MFVARSEAPHMPAPPLEKPLGSRGFLAPAWGQAHEQRP